MGLSNDIEPCKAIYNKWATAVAELDLSIEEADVRIIPHALDAVYAPVCENPPSGEPLKVYAAGVGRAVNISCLVLASPPSVRFSWVFNNSVSSERLPGDQVFTMAEGVRQRKMRSHEVGAMGKIDGELDEEPEEDRGGRGKSKRRGEESRKTRKREGTENRRVRFVNGRISQPYQWCEAAQFGGSTVNSCPKYSAQRASAHPLSHEAAHLLFGIALAREGDLERSFFRARVAQFRPKMNQELGTLQCWAENRWADDGACIFRWFLQV
ncbi:hypothetical protein GWK47_039801 [Chionoecetes opilio]|uniref:Ig-like domain-containing protein n=1 Tax=Chionoecetes opilio TaxID=41210 RepID=A0A8J4YDY0_CHIOP|nr:hypothetical protein GWK47_039801 [Chionoecetes opilio]